MRTFLFCTIIVFLAVVPRLDADDAANHLFNVRKFGAVGDGKAKDTDAIQKAIDAASNAGGGRVLLTPGIYLSGTIYLKSDVELHLTAGAVLYGSPDKDDYNAADFCPQNQVFKSDFMSGAHLVVAVEQCNVTISGRGRIDGNGKAFLKDPQSDRFLPKNKVVWRPAQMIYFCECSNVTIRDVELFNSPYWTCFLHGCEDLVVDGVRIKNRLDTANGDGIDIDCCQRGVVSNCIIESGDDCITLRAHDVSLKKKRPCEQIAVTNCVLKTSCQAVRVGVGNGVIRNCVFGNMTVHETNVGLNFHSSYSPNSPGATIDNIRFENIVMDVRVPFTVTYGHAAAETKISNVFFRGVSATARASSSVGGKAGNKLTGIFFQDVTLSVPADAKPFKVIRFVEIDGLSLQNLRIIQPGKTSAPDGFDLEFQAVERIP